MTMTIYIWLYSYDYPFLWLGCFTSLEIYSLYKMHSWGNNRYIPGTNNLKSDNNLEKNANDIVNLGLSVKNENTMVYISSLLIRNDKLDKIRKEVNDFIKPQYLTNHSLL